VLGIVAPDAEDPPHGKSSAADDRHGDDRGRREYEIGHDATPY
jgi:hypothetical protein